MKIKDKIIELRERGFSYRKIVEEIGCSKGTVSYHCGIGQKEKSRFRTRKNRNCLHPLIRKIENFTLIINKTKKQKKRDKARQRTTRDDTKRHRPGQDRTGLHKTRRDETRRD